jgi:hypothetical protein
VVPEVMRWTCKRPTEPGYYWLSGGWAEDGVIVSVEIYPLLPSPNSLIIISFGGVCPSIPGNAMWAGPIPRPSEDEEE